MAAKLGRLFLNAAKGPIAYAGRCIMARKVKAGLDELTSESLQGAVDRGVETVAKEVGLPASYVGQLLPVAEMSAVLKNLVAHQQAAVEQWALHTGHFGGLLDGVADLTVDGRAPDTGLCLLRLSRKMKMDSALAEPLRALSEALDQWQDVLQRCRTTIDDGRSLKEAYQKRRVLQGMALGMGFIVLILFGAVGLQYVQARGRVQEQLDQADPCAVSGIEQGDLGKASAAQATSVAERQAQCESRREQQRTAQEQERKRKVANEAEQAKQAARRNSCAALASALASRTLTDEALAADPSQATLIKRIVSYTLSEQDVGREQALPCAGTDASKAVLIAYAQAVLASREHWLGKHALSAQAFDALVLHKAELPAQDVLVLAWASEDRAKKAVTGGQQQAIAVAAQLCQLADKLAMSPREDCQIAISLAARKE